MKRAVAPTLFDDFPGEVFSTKATVSNTTRALHVPPRADKEFVFIGKQHRVMVTLAAPPAGTHNAWRGINLVTLTTPSGEATIDDFLTLS
jgi:hypothetical protein